MKNGEDKIMFGFYGLFGAFIGFLIFMIVLGGWEFVLAGQPAKAWNGVIALLVSLGIGGGWGLVAYKLSDREFGSGMGGLFEDPATGPLLMKRLMVIATCLAALYFIWELARTL